MLCFFRTYIIVIKYDSHCGDFYMEVFRNKGNLAIVLILTLCVICGCGKETAEELPTASDYLYEEDDVESSVEIPEVIIDAETGNFVHREE